MTTQNFEVIDRNGKRVRRDGVLQDGDRMMAKVSLMDAANPALVAGAALAQAIRRNEQFDARGHRPGFAMQDAGNAGETAREARDALVRDAWKNPATDTTPLEKAAVIVSPTGTSDADLRAAADAVIADRDKRTAEAWRGQS